MSADRLQAALCSSDVETVKKIILQQPELLEAIIDEQLCRPLHMASFVGDITMIRCLLNLGAFLHSKTRNQMNVLHIASLLGHKEVVKEVLRAKIRRNDKAHSDWTALHLATTNNHVDCVELLIAAKADINANRKPLGTPLHVASFGGLHYVAAVLLSNLANPYLPNDMGQLPIDVSEEESVTKLLQKTMEKRPEEFYKTVPLFRRRAPQRQKVTATKTVSEPSIMEPKERVQKTSQTPDLIRKRKKAKKIQFHPPPSDTAPPVPIHENQNHSMIHEEIGSTKQVDGEESSDLYCMNKQTFKNIEEVRNSMHDTLMNPNMMEMEGIMQQGQNTIGVQRLSTLHDAVVSDPMLLQESIDLLMTYVESEKISEEKSDLPLELPLPSSSGDDPRSNDESMDELKPLCESQVTKTIKACQEQIEWLLHAKSEKEFMKIKDTIVTNLIILKNASDYNEEASEFYRIIQTMEGYEDMIEGALELQDEDSGEWFCDD